MNPRPSKLRRYLGRFLLEGVASIFLVAVVAAQVNQYPYFGVAAISFAPQVTYQVGRGPFSLTTFDFNRDGILDIIVPNRDSSNLSILKGNGDGTFTLLPNTVQGGNCPIFVVSGDFNQDQNPDLAVVNHLCNTLFISLGVGDGTFTNPTIYPTAAEPRSMAIGDLNGDGYPDLAIANRLAGSISIYSGRGDGTFHPRVDYPASLNPHSIVAGDFNGDSLIDLAVANTGNNSVTLFQNLGGGGFRSLPDIPAGYGSTALVSVDLNRDGKLDLVVADVAANAVSVLIGNGNFSFGNLVHYPVGSGPFELRSGDFNGDGYPDVVVANRGANNLTVLLGKGDGTFASTTHLNSFATGNSPYDVGVGDFNKDGKADLAAVNFVDNTITILLSEEPKFADLAITKSASSPTLLAGADLTYTIEVSNPGPDPALEVVVTDLLPAKMNFISCTATDGGVCGEANGTRTVTFAQLPVGTIARITITVRGKDDICEGNSLVNTVALIARTGDPVLGNNMIENTVLGDNTAPVIQQMIDRTMIAARPGDKAGAAVSFSLPTATDNAPGVQVACTYQSGTVFPVGVTTVTCTATDACGLTASTSFHISVWDVVLVDDVTGNIFLFDSFTGRYIFKRVDTGQEYPGRGAVTRRGCEIRLTDDKRADMTLNTCFNRGSGMFRPTGVAPVFVITDRYTKNNTLPAAW